MAHWAELDDNNIVIRVVVTDNNDPAGDEGYSWLLNNLGGRWMQTSYNHRIRKQFAGIGFFYNESADVFISPQPFLSWTLDANFDWQPPKPRPEGFGWYWDESLGDWLNDEANA